MAHNVYRIFCTFSVHLFFIQHIIVPYYFYKSSRDLTFSQTPALHLVTILVPAIIGQKMIFFQPLHLGYIDILSAFHHIYKSLAAAYTPFIRTLFSVVDASFNEPHSLINFFSISCICQRLHSSTICLCICFPLSTSLSFSSTSSISILQDCL